MPNTKSAARRMRSTERRRVRNRAVKTKLHRLEKTYLAAVTDAKKEDASKALKSVTSALDKAAKRGVLHRGRVNRKKSRLALRLNKVK
jgi:small subunit ribosomal protein S20